MKVGDLVRRIRDAKHIHLDVYAKNNIGIVVKVKHASWSSMDQVKVKWTKPTWYDPEDGLSPEYPENLEVIAEGNYLERQRNTE